MPRVSDAHLEQRRQQVLEAALRCFDREGFHRTNMAQVIAESGMSAGSVYRYFPSKADLIHAAVREVFERLHGVVSTTLDDAGATPLDGVRRALESALALAGELDIDPTRVALGAWGEATRDPELKAHLREVYSALLADFAVAAGHGGLTGRRRTDAARSCLSLMFGFVVQRQLLGEDLTPARYVAGVRALGDPPAG